MKSVATSRSREMRRAASPSIDTDKSLKVVVPPEKKAKTAKVLQIHAGAGITKKNKHGRKAVLSARAKKRQEDAMDRAEANMDKKSTRVEKSKDRARTVQSRSKVWEEQNRRNEELKAAHAKLMAESEWQDEESGEESEEEVEVKALRPSAFASTVAAMLAEAKEGEKKDGVDEEL